MTTRTEGFRPTNEIVSDLMKLIEPETEEETILREQAEDCEFFDYSILNEDFPESPF